MDPEFVESASVDSFVDGNWDWEVQSLVRIHSCQNITVALACALEVEAARRASCQPEWYINFEENAGGHPLHPEEGFIRSTKQPGYQFTRTSVATDCHRRIIDNSRECPQ